MNWTIFLITVGVVAFFVVGLSLTLIFKGHNIQSEISDNPNLKARGLDCALREDMKLHKDRDCNQPIGCGDKVCGDCENNIENK